MDAPKCVEVCFDCPKCGVPLGVFLDGDPLQPQDAGCECGWAALIEVYVDNIDGPSTTEE